MLNVKDVCGVGGGAKEKGKEQTLYISKPVFLCVCVYALLFIIARTGALLSLHSLISRCHS